LTTKITDEPLTEYEPEELVDDAAAAAPAPPPQGFKIFWTPAEVCLLE
jgi:hypothetical protein